MHQSLSVNTVVNMCAEFEGFPSLYRELGIAQVWLPTTDFTVPVQKNIVHGVDTILAEEEDKTVYLHCKGWYIVSVVW